MREEDNHDDVNNPDNVSFSPVLLWKKEDEIRMKSWTRWQDQGVLKAVAYALHELFSNEWAGKFTFVWATLAGSYRSIRDYTPSSWRSLRAKH